MAVWSLDSVHGPPAAAAAAGVVQSIVASNASRAKPMVAWVSIMGDEGIFSLAPYKVQLIQVRAQSWVGCRL